MSRITAHRRIETDSAMNGHMLTFPAPLSIHHPPGGKSASTAGGVPRCPRDEIRAVGKEFSCRRELLLVPSRISSRRVENSRSTGRDLAPARARPRRRWGKAGESARVEVSDRGEIVTLPSFLPVIASRGLFPPRRSLSVPAMNPPIWSGKSRATIRWGARPDARPQSRPTGLRRKTPRDRRPDPWKRRANPSPPRTGNQPLHRRSAAPPRSELNAPARGDAARERVPNRVISVR